jgi:hypothetical protein
MQEILKDLQGEGKVHKSETCTHMKQEKKSEKE